MPAFGPGPGPTPAPPSQNGNPMIPGTSAFNPQSQTPVRPAIVAQSQLIAQPTLIAPVPVIPPVQGNTPVVPIPPVNPPAPVPVTKPCGCGCGCQCGCGGGVDVAIQPLVVTAQPPQVGVVTENPTHFVGGGAILQPNPPPAPPVIVSGPKPCDCAETKARVKQSASSRPLHKKGCGCGCNCCCKEVSRAKMQTQQLSDPPVMNLGQVAGQLLGQAHTAFINGSSRAMNIVPINKPTSKVLPLSNPSLPNITYGGGPVLTNVNVIPIFWGSQWKNDPTLNSYANGIYNFFKTILSSCVIDLLSQDYSVNGQAIQNGTVETPIIINDSEYPPFHSVPSTLDDSAIQFYITSWSWAATIIPAPGPQTLYFIYTPPGTTVTAPSEQSCVNMCGYHANVLWGVASPISFYYAVIPYPSCGGCSNNLGDFNALTFLSSHELCESITDPDWLGQNGWFDRSTLKEIGDICDIPFWGVTTLDGYTGLAPIS
jgi:hypothetical protein